MLILSFSTSALSQEDIAPAADAVVQGTSEFEFARRILTGRAFPVDVRRDAAVLLLQRAWPQGTKALADILTDTADPQGRLAVAGALAETLPKLGTLPEDFIDPLISALSAKDEKLRQTAALAVANYSHLVLPQLGRIILQPAAGTSEDTRLAAVAAVQRIKDKASAKILIEALDDQNVQLSTRCREGLEHLTGIRFGQSNAAWRAWWQQYKDKELAQWLQLYILALDSQNLQLRTRVGLLAEQLSKQIEFRWLSAQDKPRLLEELLTNPLEDVRLQGLTLSRSLFQPGPFPAHLQERLRQMVADESAPVRALAAELLRDLRDKQLGNLILARLPEETDPRVRASFAHALGYVGAGEVVQPLIDLLADPSPLVVAGAASALGNLASSKDLGPARAAIVNALLVRYDKTALTNGADATLRGEILSAMVRVGSPAFRSAFVRALQDSSALTRARAVEGLRTLPADNRRKETLAAVQLLLADPDRGVRLEVLRTIEALGAPDQLPILEVRLDPKVELDPNVRQEVWRIVMQLLAKADLKTLTAWQQKISDDDPEHQTQVLSHLERRLSESDSTSPDLIAVREKLGDCLSRLGRWQPATGKYGLAYDQALALSNPDNTEILGRLALKLLDALLHQGDFQQSVAHIKDISASLQLEQEALGTALDYLQTLLDSKNAESAAELISALNAAALPGLGRKPLKQRFAQCKARFRNLQ
ncbi:MAG: hypothetical protein GWP14_07165 [Actinobacteria bacterium]|nr:hypothetical protein [Actinomycetota bacterium]